MEPDQTARFGVFRTVPMANRDGSSLESEHGQQMAKGEGKRGRGRERRGGKAVETLAVAARGPWVLLEGCRGLRFLHKIR